VIIKAYIGILILAGVYRCRGESIDNLWDDKVGRPFLGAIMSKESFQKLSRVIRFDDKVTRQHRRTTNKVAPIRDLWEKWIGNFYIIYNLHENMTVDE